MKAKFTLGFLTGFKDVPQAWPGMRQNVPFLEPLMAMAGDGTPEPGIERYKPVKSLVFECRRIDDDKAAVFDFMEIA